MANGKAILVLGGAGGIGSVATRALTVFDEPYDRIVVADLRKDGAQAVVDGLGDPRLVAAGVDVTDHAALVDAMREVDVVLNCVGPFYRFGPPVLLAAIEAGVSALVGMGNSPGLANVFVRLCADGLLDSVESVDIMHIHGGEPEEGAAVNKHRIHAMTNDVPLFIDGEMITVRQLEDSGAAHTIETDFHDVGTFPVYPYPHPETITLPANIPGLKRATNLGVIFPLSYFHLTQDMVRVGACTTDPIQVQGQLVTPIEFSVAHIQARRPELLAEAGIDGPAGCLKVVVSGQRKGGPRTYMLQLSSRSAGAGEGTGIPAAAGAILMGRGQIAQRGVFPPEVGVAPLQVLATAFKAAAAMGQGDDSGTSVRIDQIDADGTVTPVPLPF